MSRILVLSDCPRLHEQFRLDVARQAFRSGQGLHVRATHDSVRIGGTEYLTVIGSHPLPTGVEIDGVYVFGISSELRQLGWHIAKFHGVEAKCAPRLIHTDNRQGDSGEDYWGADELRSSEIDFVPSL